MRALLEEEVVSACLGSTFTALPGSGRLAADAGLPPLAAAQDRVMVCGSEPGSYGIERAFVER